MDNTIRLPKLEISSKDNNGLPTYIIKGHATVPDHIYAYKKGKDKSLKEFFSKEGVSRIKNKLKKERVFVDVEHSLGTVHSSEVILNRLKAKTGNEFSEEIEYIKDRVKHSDVPMFKLHEFDVEDDGFCVEIRGNPFYREIDEEHKKHFDAIWGSVESGFINGLSFNMKPTSVIQINDETTQIDDADIYGISLTGAAANDAADIFEVVRRSVEYMKEEKGWQKIKKKTTSLMM